jgi:hypothetical protein
MEPEIPLVLQLKRKPPMTEEKLISFKERSLEFIGSSRAVKVKNIKTVSQKYLSLPKPQKFLKL